MITKLGRMMIKINSLASGFKAQGACALSIIALVFACSASAALSAQEDDGIMIEHLRRHAVDGQGDNSLRAVLGLENFVDSYASPARDYGITGLKSSDAFVRIESAKIISWLGDSRHIPILLEAANQETNPVAKQAILRLAAKLQLSHTAYYAQRLLNFTQTEKNKNNAAYLACALGQEPFEGKITGLGDPNPDMRIESAAIIAQFGTLQQANILLEAAARESDSQAREKLFLAAYKLQFRLATDAQALIRKFILKGAEGDSRQMFNGEVPREALLYVLEQAEDLGAGEDVISGLEDLKRNSDQDSALVARIEEAIGNIRTRNNNTNAQLFDALKNGTLALQPWMTRALFKENTATTQSSSCAALIALLGRRALAQADALKKAMDQHQVLRSENLNPSFEFYSSGPKRSLRLPIPRDSNIAPSSWHIEVNKDSGNAVSYAARGTVKANSYARCLRLKNVSGQTRLKNSRTSFQGPLPAGVEFGLSYKLAGPEPEDAFIVEDENGISYLTKDANGRYIESAAEKAKITLKVNLIFADAAHTKRVAQVSEDNFSNANGWSNLSGKFDTYDNAEKTPIQSSELEVIVEGTTSGIFIDDVFVRRSEQEFFHDGPVITAITLPGPKVLAGEFVSLTAQVETNDPAGSAISGQWLSGGYRLGSAAIARTEPAPGSKATSKAVIRALVQFNKPGVREVTLRVTDSFGIESEKLAESYLEILTPQTKLGSTYEILPGGYVSGVLPLTLTIDDFHTLDGYLGVEKNELYADNTLIAQDRAQPWHYNLDTTRLSEGLHTLKAVSYLKRNEPGSQPVPVVSNILMVNLRNNINAEDQIAPIMAD